MMRSFRQTIAATLGIMLLLTGFTGISSGNSPELIDQQKKEKKAKLTLFYDADEPAITFAAKDLHKALTSKGITATLKSLDDLPKIPKGLQIVIAKNDAPVLAALKAAGGRDVNSPGGQDYALRVGLAGDIKSYWSIGGGRIGAMYGGIHIAEIVKAFGLESMKDEDQSPYIAKRGIKFNIPLDERSPSHDDRGTSAQANIVNMWDFTFWAEYLDLLAKQRYNVLSLWNQHPFPSMVKLEEYPEVALNNVYNKSGKVKEMTIDQKVDLWKKIMEYACDRGIEIYIITWNIHMNGAAGKHGITEDENNNITKDYLRKSVEKIFLTYPLLAGIGVTAGENMGKMSEDEKEEWMWQTYGKGVQDVQKTQPERHIRFIHRHWWTSFDKIESRFGQLRDGFDMSFKYSRAKMYSAYNPVFAEKELLPTLPDNIATWWNIRNDDIYNLRWGDAEYAKQYILHMPKGEKTAGYYMGSDRFVWGRESISKTPQSPRMLENEKHWYSFLLWGRLGYDPETPTSLLKGLIKDRFSIKSADELYEGWRAASAIIPAVNRFHWFSWDYLWWPEAGISTGYGVAIAGYHDINDFINAPVMNPTEMMTIKDYAEVILKGQTKAGKTPMEVADMIEAFAKNALEKVRNMPAEGSDELSETIKDIRATAHLGNYYAQKIRGAANFKLWQDSMEEKYRTTAIADLEGSLASWKEYARLLDSHYIKMDISMMGIFDWDKIEKEVIEDINIVRNAK